MRHDPDASGIAPPPPRAPFLDSMLGSCCTDLQGMWQQLGCHARLHARRRRQQPQHARGRAGPQQVGSQAAQPGLVGQAAGGP